MKRKYMQGKRICALLLAVCLLAGSLPVFAGAAADASGTCGKDLRWVYAGATGQLVISGTGEMDRYQDHTGNPDCFPPWYSFRRQVKSLRIEEGLTVMGDYAFNGMTDLQEAVLPESLTSIREGAFLDCESLSSLHFPEGLTAIGQSAFGRCKSLQAVSFPQGLSELGQAAFTMCASLKEISIPESLPVVLYGTFSGCSSLEVLRLSSAFQSAGMDAFYGCALKHIYFDGTKSQWEQVRWGVRNDISGAEIHCLREPEPTPTPEPTQAPTPEPVPSPTASPADTPTPLPTPEVPATPTPRPTPTAKPKPTLRPIETPVPESPYDRYIGTWKAEQNFNYTLNGVPGVGSWELRLHVNNIYSAYNNGVKDTVLCGISFIRSNKSVLHSSDPDNWLLYESAIADPAEIVDGTASFDADPIYSDACYGTIRFTDEGIVFNMTLYKDLSDEGRTVPRMLAQQQLPRDLLLKMDGFQAGPWKPKPTPSGPQPEGRTPFTDVYAGMWYVDAVRYAYTEALFNGTSATTFSPSSPMTRAQIVQVLANRTEGYFPENYDSATCFADVPVGSWMCAPIRWAYRNDLTDGTAAGTFSPSAELTREQLATFLYRYAARTGANTSAEGDLYAKFPDTKSVSSWAQTAMQWAVNRGIITGSGGKLDPKGKATRAQVAQMFLNAKNVLTSTQLLPQEERPDSEY